MKRIASVFVALGLTLHLGGLTLWARSTTTGQASEAVAGWLKADSRPLGAILGDTVVDVTPYADRAGVILYYVVSLEPAGFVIASADDLIEPIIAYSEGGTFDPSPENPLGALVSRDLPARIAAVRRGSKATDGYPEKTRKQRRWRALSQSSQSYAGGGSLQSSGPVSDVRVAPFIQSRWSQSGACGGYCYNYYTPSHYPCGCVATAVAQIMLYHRHPTDMIGVHEFMIEVDETEEKAFTRGGDGWGGSYQWDYMLADPRSSCSDLMSHHRQAIGALCYDVGIAANMSYAASGSSAYFEPIAEALVTTFGYGNAVTEAMSSAGAHFLTVVNSNLDARLPVALGIVNEEDGHAVIADGYGYSGATLYHHVNFGWAGSADAWYNLPDFSGVYPVFDTIDSCTYNIYPNGSGQIVSGRVTDAAGRPVPDVMVAAQRAEVRAGGLYTATTDEQGIYALAKLPRNSTYTLTVSDDVLQWDPVTLETRGNTWGVDFRSRSTSGKLMGALFVDREAVAGANDGTSWANALIDLQDALAAADWSPDVNQVWVANGTYLPDRGIGERTLSFALSDGVAVYGGFAGLDSGAFPGGETALDQRDPVANPTILSGDLKANDAGFRNCTDNSMHVVTADGVGDQTVLDGFTITGGNADGAAGDDDASGGGMCVSDAAAVIANCTFAYNAAGSRGGGLFLLGDSSARVTNCRFDRNRAASGGGVAHVDASATFIGCVFAGNSAVLAPAAAGGAIYASGSPLVIVANCTLADNGSAHGGAFYINNSTATLTNCIAWSNQAGQGPAFDVTSSATILIRYCNIDGGTASINVQEGGVLDWSEGNMDADPLFVDPAKHDWHILLESPCVDAGDPDASMEGTPYDMDGQQRIMDGRIDIGADESLAGDSDAGV